MGLPSFEQWGVRDAVEGRDESGRVLLLSCVAGRLWKCDMEEKSGGGEGVSGEDVQGKTVPGKTYHGGGSVEMALLNAGVGPGDGGLESGTAESG